MSQPTQEEMDGLYTIQNINNVVHNNTYNWKSFANIFLQSTKTLSLYLITKATARSSRIGRLLRSLNLNPDDEDIVKIEKEVGE